MLSAAGFLIKTGVDGTDVDMLQYLPQFITRRVNYSVKRLKKDGVNSPPIAIKCVNQKRHRDKDELSYHSTN